MAVQLVDIPPLDPNGFTGYARIVGGIARTGTITADTYYGTSGTVEYARWIYVGTTGNISYVRWDGTTQVLNTITAGIWHPIYSIKVNSSGTTASNLVWGS